MRAAWPALRTAALLAVVLLLAGGCSMSPDAAPGTPPPAPATRAPHPPPPPVGPPGTWTNLMDDEFTGNSLNTRLWQPNRFGKNSGDAPFNPDLEAAWFSPADVAVGDGMLSLTVHPQPRTLLKRHYPYSSGMVQSPAGATIGPGSYVEARIEVPRCDGCWPAFWLDPPAGSPPEIDGFEFFDTSDDAQSHPSFTYHSPSDASTDPQTYGDPAVDYRSGFHTYGILWEDDAVTPYVDGVGYPQVAATKDIATQRLAIIINLSVMAGHHPAEGSRLRVDWVRVWTPASTPGPATQP